MGPISESYSALNCLFRLQVSGRNSVSVLEDERTKVVEHIVDTEVGREGQFRRVEGRDRSISTSTTLYIYI